MYMYIYMPNFLVFCCLKKYLQKTESIKFTV